MRIQHNIAAMNAYRNYNLNTKALSGNLEKLSSGYKINRAGDDAAGLAISEKMRAQITGLDAAQKNVKDGISLVKTAEGAMQEIQDMLNRMDYLATQSANGTYQDAVDRENLQKEVEALKTEINRIADSANFNGIKLLDGSLDSATKVSTKAGEFEVGGAGVGALPDVGDALNVADNTVLHKGAAADETENAFGVEFHSAKIEGDKDDTFTLTIGDIELTGTLTGTAQGETAITAEDLVAALAGDGSTKFTLTTADGDYDKDTGLTINGGTFKAAASESGKGVTFTQEGDDELTGTGVVMDVKLEVGDDEEPTGEPPTVDEVDGTDAGPGFTAGTEEGGTQVTQAVSDFTDAGGKILTGTKAAVQGLTALSIGGYTIDISDAANSLTDTTTTITDAIAAIKAEIVAKVGEANTAAAGGTTTYDEIDTDSIDVKATATGFTVDFNKTTQTYSDTGAAATTGKLTIDFDGKTGADVIGSNITIDGKTYEFVAAADDAADGNVAVVVAENADADTMATALAGVITGDNKGANVGTVAVDDTTTSQVNVEYGAEGAAATLEHSESGAENVAVAVSGQWNWQTTDQSVKASASDVVLASTAFDLTEEMATAGASIRIGEDTYTFTDEKSEEENTVYVGDLDLSKAADLKTAVQRLTDAAAGNGTYTVGQKDGQVTLTEKVDYTTGDQKYDLSTKEGIEESLGFTTVSSSTGKGTALTLQIGDTADDYNLMKVSVGDMHVKALGIGDINIGNQKGAQEAIQKIKDAINNVSSVRGDLGAIQNRLDHTGNNLSVMAENIQDAESTIRDTDVASEMMSYVKNNILVQSAQAMLAQANQLPQGVLQLLG